MLKASLIVDTVVTTLKTIPDLVTAMADDANRIKPFYSMIGLEKNLEDTILAMLQPSILVAYAGIMGGNFGGFQIWKHQVDIYFRPPNTANISPALSGWDVLWLMMNKPVNGGALNIRQIEILPNQVYLMDTPSAQYIPDLNDFNLYCAKCVIGEIGDQP